MTNLISRYCARTLAAILLVAAGLQAYACIATYIARQTVMPANYGNFPENRRTLADSNQDGPVTFAVVGDTRSTGTFERLARDIAAKDPAFVVILGDWVTRGTPDEHALFRLESPEFGFHCPVFFTPGNHDVEPDEYPMKRFENEYGPENFSFVYKNNLFIFISHLDKRFSNEKSMAYLRSFDRQMLERYDNRFVFMHIPPWVSPDIKERHTKDELEVMRICRELNINYVIAADFHGYNRTTRDGVEYIITGGGGARLDTATGKQFYHAVVLTVDGKTMSEQIIPGSSHFELGEWIEKNSVSHIGPFMFRHMYAFVVVNVLGMIAVWAALRNSLRRKEPQGMPTSHADGSGHTRHG